MAMRRSPCSMVVIVPGARLSLASTVTQKRTLTVEAFERCWCWSLLSKRHSRIYRNHLAGHVTRIGAQQKHSDARNIAWRRATIQKLARPVLLPAPLRRRCRRLGLDDPRGNGIHANSISSKLSREPAGHAHDRTLARYVMQEEIAAPECGVR